MKILVTGAKGFLGKNLVAELRNQGYEDILQYSRAEDVSVLEKYTEQCDFVFHFAGINRPQKTEEFLEGNYKFTNTLLDFLKKNDNPAPVLFSSSIQAESDNPYGESKKAGEKAVINYGKDTGAETFIYRLPNLFGKWSRPNYNTVIATFCHNIARNIDIRIDNPDAVLELSYVDDVLKEFMRALKGKPTKENGICMVPVMYSISLKDLAETLKSFKDSRKDIHIPNMSNDLVKKLYSTYLSFLPEDDFDYDIKMNVDERGSFTELFRTPERGQVSINVSKPGITKGNHWHHTKNEKFLVVSGEGLIRFRKYYDEQVIEYRMSGDKLKVVDIPPGYTHSIVNVGEKDLVTVMWANECFNPEEPDTYYLEV